MDINTINNTNTLLANNTKPNNKEETVYIDKKLIEEAKLHSEKENQVGVIYGNNTIALDMQNVQALKKKFKDDFSKYENILIAKDDAKKYLDDINHFVLVDLEVASADKNKDGIISVAESLHTKNQFNPYEGTIDKPSDVLHPELIKILEQDNSRFMSINEIINTNIRVDKNKDGEVTVKEVGKYLGVQEEKEVAPPTGSAMNLEDRLEELMDKLKEIEQKIASLTSKMQSASEEEMMILNEQLIVLMGQQTAIMAQVQVLLKIMMGQ